VTHDLAVAGCGRCPFAGREEPGIWLPVCKAAVYLDPEDREWYRPFEVREGGEWVFPSPPPEWCPLRAGAVTIRVAAGDETVGPALLPAVTDHETLDGPRSGASEGEPTPDHLEPATFHWTPHDRKIREAVRRFNEGLEGDSHDA
jgi:hypothetical protein